MKMPDGFKVIGDKVLVRAELENDNVDGIVIPDNCRIHDWTAEVVQVGDRCLTLKRGDKVLYSKDNAVIPFSDSPEYRILREGKVIALLRRLDGDDFDSIFPLGEWLLCKPEEVKRNVGGIHMPDSKLIKVYGARVLRKGNVTVFADGDMVYFDTSVSIECYQGDERLCLAHASDVQLHSSK